MIPGLFAGGVGQYGIDTGDIANSLRFRGAASAYLTWTPSSNGDSTKITMSAWVKRGKLGSAQGILSAGSASNNATDIYFDAGDKIVISHVVSGGSQGSIATTAIFRDPSAHLHVVAVIDLSLGSSKFKIYVNGVQQSVTESTAITTTSTFFCNTTYSNRFGYSWLNNTYLDGYLSRVCFVDGQALTPSSFGYLNTTTNEWVSKTQSEAKAVVDAGGANSFMLDFDDVTSLTTLGYDKSSKGNNWTLNNFSLTAGVTYDHMLDGPGNSYATLNPLNSYPGLLSEGNLKATAPGATWYSGAATQAVNSGKWYWEVQPATSGVFMSGISPTSQSLLPAGVFPGSAALGWGYYASTGQKFNNGAATAYGATYTSGDVIGVALDMDAGTLTFYKNNVSQGTAATGLSGYYTPAIGTYNPGEYGHINAGQRPFAYTPPTGFLALCQANLPDNGTVTVSGTFTGNGADDGPFVWINGVPKTLTINSNGVTFGTHADKTAGGFKLRTSSASYNTAGSNTWTATIDTNIQNIFKWNNAEGNP